MKITCNIIEDLLPLYVDDMVSEDSRKLVEEHLKECPACRKMQKEMMRENCLSAGRKDGNSAQINKTEAEPLKKIRRRIRKKRILSVILAVALVAAAGGIGHYWYYDKENYISWDEANISVKDGKVYSAVSPLGRLKSILSVDQKNMFYMMSETMWTRRQILIQKTNSGRFRLFRKHMTGVMMQLQMKLRFRQELKMSTMWIRKI